MYFGRKLLLTLLVSIIVTFYLISTKTKSAIILLHSDVANSNGTSTTLSVQSSEGQQATKKATKPGEIDCYKVENAATIQHLGYEEPPKGQSIFFHETSCHSYKSGAIVINNRQACAVESAARLNPNSQVFLLYISPGAFPNNTTESHRYLEALRTYPNVNIRHVNYGDYVRGTPVEALYRDGLIERSNYPLIHASDIIRYVTLWRFGGIYLDLDVIVTKSLAALPPNFAGQESEDYVAAGVLSFDHTGIGHEWATQCLQDLQKNFDGQQWGYNGPGVVTRLFQRLCNATKVGEVMKLRDGTCEGYRVYPKEIFYPVPWERWRMYFEQRYHDEVDKMTANCYAIHVWNKFSKVEKASVNSSVAYVRFAKKFCPAVFEKCDKVF